MSVDPVNICLSKIQYRNERIAQQQAGKITKRTGIVHKPYCCDVCFAYHLTSGGYLNQSLENLISETVDKPMTWKELHKKLRPRRPDLYTIDFKEALWVLFDRGVLELTNDRLIAPVTHDCSA